MNWLKPQAVDVGDWQGKVVVVTGASAGVGRAVALAFAERGARVALLARDETGLNDTRAEIEAAGGEALCVPIDVADARAVEAAADTCEARLGPIAVWVNNAMTTVFSPVAELAAEEIRRVSDVVYLGTVHGTLSALARMRRQGFGVIVQVGSALAYRAIPLQAAYCAAKHAVRGFTDAVRTELIHDESPVAVTTVHLPAIDTPQFDWARTHMPNQPRPVAPVYQPEAAARAIVYAAARPVPEYWLGSRTPLLTLANDIAPGLLDRYLAGAAWEGQDTGAPVPPERPDNLFEPVKGRHHLRGTFGHEAQTDAVMVDAAVARGAAAALLVGAGALLGAWLAGRR